MLKEEAQANQSSGGQSIIADGHLWERGAAAI